MIELVYLAVLLSRCIITTNSSPIAGCDQVGYFCYWMSNSSALTNNDAQAVCAADQGRLPIFSTSTDYNNFITYKSSKTAISGTSVWLGYWNYNSHSASAPGSWSDKNGTGLSGFYTNWNSGEPNDASPGEKCVNLNGNMNDLPCTYPQQFVCQSRLSMNCDSCQVSGSLCFFYSTAANNIEAQSLCASAGAILPTFNNSADLNNLNSWIGSLGLSRFWVGYWNYAAHSASAPGIWKTQNGVGAVGSYLPWNTGEPNDSGGNEKCAEVVGGSATPLNDNSWSYTEPSTVCQCLAPPTPTTSLTCANCNRTAANCYLTIYAAATNTQAKSLCASAGGVLPTFKNLTEVNSFRTYWWPRRTEPSAVWIGYWNFASHSASTPGIWTDQNGITTSYAPWLSGEPSDSHGNEKCGAIYPYASSGMNDIPCSTSLTPTICDCAAFTTTSSTTSTATTSTTTPTTTSTSTTSTTTPTTTSTSTTSTTTPTTTSTSTTSTTTPTTTSTSTTSTTSPTTTSTSTTSTTTPTTTSTSTTSTTTPTTTSTSTTSTTTPTTTSTSTTSTTTPTTTSTSTTSTTTPTTTSTSTTSTTTPTTTSTSSTSTTTPTTTSTSTTSTTTPTTTSTSTTSTTTPTTTSSSTTSTTTPTTASTSTTSTAAPTTTSTSTTSTSSSTTTYTSTTSTASPTITFTSTGSTTPTTTSTSITTGITMAEASINHVSIVKAMASRAHAGWIFPLLLGVVSLITMLSILVCCWIICSDKRQKKNFKGQTEPHVHY